MIVTNDQYWQVYQKIIKAGPITLDTETTGLDIFRGARICGISLLIGQESFYLPFRHGEGENLPISVLPDLCTELVKHTLTGFNSKFDVKMLLVEMDKSTYPAVFEDVMLAAHLMNENELNFTLKGLSVKYLSADAKDEQEELVEEIARRGLTGKGNIWRLPVEMVAPYAEQDVILTAGLRRFYAKHLHIWQLYDLWQELNQYMLVTTRLEMYGMRLDTDMIQHRIQEASLKRTEAAAALDAVAGYKVNANSSPQMCALLGVSSSAKDILETLDHPAVPHIIQTRQWGKVTSTYYKPFMDSRSPDDVIHPNLNQIGTVTGRESSSDPNMQATPRDDDKDEPIDKEAKSYVKTVFVARPGCVLVQADYKQAEVYLGAHYAQAKKLIELLRNNVDVHKETAVMLGGIHRSVAKRLNFAQQYGIGAPALAQRIWIDAHLRISVEQAAEYIRLYNSVHPEMKRLYFDTQKLAKEQGYIRMWTGRCRHYNGREWTTADGKGSPEHKASSNLIQGGVGELLRHASTAIDAAGIQQMLRVHDSIIMEAPEDQIDEVIPEIRHCMTALPEFEQFTVPFKVDIEVGHRWSDLRPYEAGMVISR